MCGSNPDLLPEVQSATCFSGLAVAFGGVTFIAGLYWPFGTVSVLAGLFGVIAGAMVCCCGPMRRQEQTPGFATRMQVLGALFIVGAAAHFVQLILLILAFVDHFPKCRPGAMWGHGDPGCSWHIFTLILLVVIALFAIAAMVVNVVTCYHCILAKRAILRVGSDPPSGERISTQWREDLQHRGPTAVIAEATVVADSAPVQTVVGMTVVGIPAARPPPTRASSLPALTTT